MNPHPQVRRILAGSLTAAVVGAGLTLAGPLPAAQSDPAAPGRPADPPGVTTADDGGVKTADGSETLGARDQELLDEALSRGERWTTVILAVDPGQTDAVASRVRAAGGVVGNQVDKVGYVRATLPTTKVEATARLAAVDAVDLEQVIQRDDPVVAATSTSTATAAGPGAQTPDDNPYMPTNETGAVAFKKANPTADGRGVTIGILDSGVDLDHPALTKTSTGARKIVDWVTATDPLEDASWRPMLTAVSGPSFTYNTTAYTAPAGSYQVSQFSESITAASEPAGDVNRDGDTTDRFGVLYDPATHDIWVDANQDGTFATAEKMRPYKEKYQVGHFGKDKAGTALVEKMPFVVEYREDVDTTPAGRPGTADFVNIGIVEDAHGSHVAGITAANAMFGGDMDGAAPGAEVVSSRACTWGGGCTNVALTDGMMDLVLNRGVEVVNMSIGGLPALNDANNARARLYDRLIDISGVQIYISAGNSGPGINTVGDPSVATDVVSVASSISKATWKANYGATVSSARALHNFSSRGPREDGGFKPDVMAPGSAVSTVPRWLKQPDLAEAGYTLPVGYAMFNGTSMASPQAAGSAALLLSAARQRELPVTPEGLRTATYTNADFLAGTPAVGQGRGQVDTVGTYNTLLRRPASTDYTVDAPVCTLLSDLLATPDRGTGLLNTCAPGAGGQNPDQARTYPVFVTRNSGPSGSVAHTLSFLGNDGTFTAPQRVSLPLGTRTRVNVTAQGGAGLHSAIMRLDRADTPYVDADALTTVVVAPRLARPSYSSSLTGSVGRNLTRSLFVAVPEGATSLQVDLGGIASGSQTRFIAFSPYGVPVESTSSLECFTNFSNRATCDPNSRSYENPLPGIWEIEVEARRTSPLLDNPLRLTAAVQGVVVDPPTQTLASVTAGTPTAVSWNVKNTFGPVVVRGEGGPLGSANTQRPSIADGASQTYAVTVPQGAETFEATIGNPADAQADLDVSVLRDGVLVGQSADGDSEESVVIEDPAAGAYTVVVDGYSVPAGTTAYDYLDVFTSPALGTLAVTGADRTLPAGGTLAITGQLTAASAPQAGRQLFGQMDVVTGEDTVLGSGRVVVQNVVGAGAAAAKARG